MRRPFVFFVCFAAGLTGTLQARAGELGPQKASIADVIVDAEAAAFFEHALRLSQARRIEAATADQYRALSAAERAEFRTARRAQWLAMSEEEQAALRGVKAPSFANLTDAQKMPFRRNAAFSATRVIQRSASAGSSEI